MRLAARGSRQLTNEVEKIEDDGELTQVRRQARTVLGKTAISSLVLMLLSLALPAPG